MKSLEEFFESEFIEGNRYNIINRFAGSCAVLGIDIEDCLEFYRKYKDRDDESREKLIRRTYEKYNNGEMVLTLKEYNVDVLGYFNPKLIKKQKDNTENRLNVLNTLIKNKNITSIDLTDLTIEMRKGTPEFNYLLRRNINEENIFKYSLIGINKLSNRVVFPIFNKDGVCVCYSARSINNTEPRYLFPNVKRDGIIWNINNADFSKPVILTEGIIDGILAMQYTGIQSVSTLSKFVTKKQSIILSLFPEVILCFDGDVDDSFIDLIKRSIETKLYVVKIPDKKDVGELTENEFKVIFNTQYKIQKIKENGGFCGTASISIR